MKNKGTTKLIVGEVIKIIFSFICLIWFVLMPAVLFITLFPSFLHWLANYLDSGGLKDNGARVVRLLPVWVWLNWLAYLPIASYKIVKSIEKLKVL